MEEEVKKPRKISRRSFLVGAATSFLVVAAFFAGWNRSKKTAHQIVEFFGFDPSVQQSVQNQLHSLRKENPGLYRQTVFFFSYGHLAPESMKARVIREWSFRLFSHRSIAWPYIHYPSVDDFSICNGMIRESD